MHMYQQSIKPLKSRYMKINEQQCKHVKYPLAQSPIEKETYRASDSFIPFITFHFYRTITTAPGHKNFILHKLHLIDFHL